MPELVKLMISYYFVSYCIYFKCKVTEKKEYKDKKVHKNLSLRSLCTFLYHFSITSLSLHSSYCLA